MEVRTHQHSYIAALTNAWGHTRMVWKVLVLYFFGQIVTILLISHVYSSTIIFVLDNL